MGTIVSTAKLASAFKANNGQTYYVLFEETYGKRDYPHQPTWNCMHIGGLESTLKRIFKAASICVGGLLVVRGGRSLPHQYIADWLKELSNPVMIPDMPVALKISDEIHASVPAEKTAAVLSTLRDNGYEEIAQTLASGGVHATSLYQYPQLLETIYGQPVIGIGAWRIIKGTPLFNARCPALGYNPEAVSSPMPPLPAILKLDEYNRLVQGTDGQWRLAGWDYMVIGDYVKSLWEEELKAPGTYTARIKAYSQHVHSAPQIPSGTLAVIDLEAPLTHDWEIHSRDRALRDLGYEETGGARCHQIPVAFGHKHADILSRMPQGCVTWQVGQPEQGQLSLLA